MSCSDVQTIKAGDGSKTQFSFDFPYIFKSEIHVYFWNATTKEYDEKLTTDSTYPWRITDANPTIVEFTSTAPPAPATPSDPGEPTVDNVKIRRITKVDDIRALFNPGSAIRSDDLNKNFEQLRYAIQESNCQGIPDDVDQYLKDYYWDRYDNTLYDGDTWVSDDTKIATTAAMDARFLDETNETYTKAELAADSNVLPDDDVALPTTGTLKDYVDHAVETDILVNDTGLTKTATGGQVTLGIAEGSVDLDRIKPADIITSSESNPNNDTTIATTAKIDDMIDAAITGDIAVDSTGLTVTDDGDGTITLGIGSNSVDFDRIKNDDIITKAEQDSGSPAAADSNIFTASAAAKRFDTLVQTGTPSESSYEVGKTWLQNDDDQTLKIWNGSTWLDVASGGSFRTQDKVIYVDKTGGDDSKTGHRISGPKLTIKAAINDINADISTSIKTGGSGYVDATYQDVPLTGGTTGSGLTADITVSGGAVTAVTDINASTLEEYQIGDILSAADSNLGNGGGSGFELEVTGGGDGMTVIVAAGIYQEIAPIQIKRRNVSIVGMALRSTIVHPTVATEKPSSNGNSALFELNSGSFIQNLTLTGMQASSSGTNTIDSVLPDKQGWNFAFYDGAFITKSPYIQNCTNFSDSQIDNSDLRAHRPRGGSAGDLTNAPTGGGMLVDGSVPKTTSPLRSMVADSYTHVGLNGPGILVTNNGYAQCTSSYAFFNKYHIKTLNGGQANLAASTTDFGEKALVADGKSTSAIFTAQVNGAASDGDLTFDIDNVTAGTGWFGDDTKPASNMLVTVNSVTYPILSSTVITGGHRVTVSRPDPNNRSTNLGLNGAVADDAAVSFFLRSQIASSGHTMEYVGSGMDYDALPENGGVPDESAQITELNNGKIWTAITDHNGKFKIGGNQTDDPIFEVDQQLGFVTIPEGSIAFNLLSDTTPQLGGNLDVNGNEIVSDSNNENIVLNPHGTGVVDVSTSRITNVTDPTDNQDAATKAYVDTQVSGVTTPDKIAEGNTEAEVVDTGTDGHFKVTTEGTERMRIDKDGNVGIGTTSPDFHLDVNGNIALTEGQVLAWHDGNGNKAGDIFMDSSDNIVFRNTSSVNERLRIDSSGRILVNTSTARTDFFGSTGLNSLFNIEGTNNATRATSIVHNSNDAAQHLFVLGKSRGAAANAVTVVADDDPLGGVSFQGADGAKLVEAARVEASVDGTPGTDDMPGRLTFSTRGDGVSSLTERMRIDSSGKIGVGTTSPKEVVDARGAAVFSGDHATSQNAYGTAHGIMLSSTNNLASIKAVSNGSNNVAIRFIPLSSGSGSEAMRIDSSGRLNIGATSNSYTEALLQTSTSVGSFFVTRNSHLLLQNKNSSTTNWWNIAPRDNGNLTIGNGAPGSDGVITDQKIVINGSGNVGIGTSSPTSYGNSQATLVIEDDTNPAICWSDTGQTRDWWAVANGSNLSFNYADGGGSGSASNVTSALSMTNSGNVGIGTGSPGDQLHIHEESSSSCNVRFTSTDVANGFFVGFDGQERAQVWHTANKDMMIATNNIERVRISNAGNVGIGSSTINQTSSGRTVVGINGSTSALLNLNHGNTLAGFMYGADDEFRMEANGTRPLIFRGNSSERMRIDSLGRLLVGTTGGDQDALLTVARTGDGGSSPSTISSSTVATFRATGGLSHEAHVSILGGNTGASRLNFGDRDDEDVAGINYDHSNNFMQFNASAAERMRVTSDGKIRIKMNDFGNDPSATNSGLQLFDTSGGAITSAASVTTGSAHAVFLNPNGVCGTIQTSGSATAYLTSSDYRLKENVVDLNGAITRVKQLAPKRFNFIADADTTVDGFLAHEAQTVVPEAVTGTHNEVDDDGNAVMQGIDQAKLVPLLTAALQEAIAKIETLETKVAALEAAE